MTIFNISPVLRRISAGLDATMASRLLDKVRRTTRRRDCSIHTEKSYCVWVKRYVLFDKMRSRADLQDGEKMIEAFINHLAIDLHVAPSTQNQAMNALVFLHKHVVKEPLDEEINAERAPKLMKLPGDAQSESGALRYSLVTQKVYKNRGLCVKEKLE